jgi:tRNA1(Val) A37 N6-methylase TrmN6
VTGLERDTALAALAGESARRSGLAGRVTVVTGDLAAPPPEVAGRIFDHVATNPPFLAARSAGARGGPKDDAHVEGLPLATWLALCLRRLRSRGTLTLVHRADRLPDILAGLGPRVGDIAVLPVWPRADAVMAGRVIVAARKGGRGPARLLRGLVLHTADGSFTSEAAAVLRDAAALPLDGRPPAA